jgi:hypothetical protein
LRGQVKLREVKQCDRQRGRERKREELFSQSVRNLCKAIVSKGGEISKTL